MGEGLRDLTRHTNRDLGQTEGSMAVAKNVARSEKVVRIVIGVILVALGFLFTGFWKPLSIAAGCFLLVTAFVEY